MKYLKFSVLTFFTAITFSFVVAKAQMLYINGVTVPSLSLNYTTNTVLTKTNSDLPQRVLKQSATDNVSGADRAVEAATYFNIPMNSPSTYKPLTTNSWVDFNTKESLTAGDYKLKIRATKSTMATVNFWGAWSAN